MCFHSLADFTVASRVPTVACRINSSGQVAWYAMTTGVSSGYPPASSSAAS